MITPLRSQILVRLVAEAQPSSALHVVRAATPTSTHAEVLAVGEEVREVRVGARVVVSRLQGIEVGELLLLPESAVLAVVPDEHSCAQCGGTLDYENNCIAGCAP